MVHVQIRTILTAELEMWFWNSMETLEVFGDPIYTHSFYCSPYDELGSNFLMKEFSYLLEEKEFSINPRFLAHKPI